MLTLHPVDQKNQADRDADLKQQADGVYQDVERLELIGFGDDLQREQQDERQGRNPAEEPSDLSFAQRCHLSRPPPMSS
ncbi:MAG: hypothetical protein HC871_11090 [Rhizobiales bacterium]|nr:hypothetical protein [Hyphomicrobiales bacterium]